MQKIVTITTPSDIATKETYAFNEIKEVNKILEQGYKVDSITSCNTHQGNACVFVLVLKKEKDKAPVLPQ